MNLRRVGALVLRYTYVYRRSLLRLLEVFFWPAIDLLVWGFLTLYLEQEGRMLPAGIAFLVGAVIFWDIIYRAQQGITLSFLEDIWSRNLLNLFSAPVRVTEFVAATCLVGILKTVVVGGYLAVVAFLLYRFNLLSVGPALLPLFANLLLMGWSLGITTTGLLLRWGQAAEALAWAIPFAIQPFSAVFYPVSALPSWLRPLAGAIPATHVFEGMRSSLRGGSAWRELLCATLINLVYLAVACGWFAYCFAVARRKGLLVKIGTQ
ncbi:Transport permease protein [Methylacidimicrobium sp. AP8]|uniref:ABC transporter permease n=1 Tax=Methylacidimicrobium sp. AP8 TaxID=2730359 RepID=UPI0018C14D0C|nr:ABC transporter permease [Methylacidimicrobium sp. AP8]CAB4242829.1 Transport permease protein [Methylacidimicrobium sp. AP8]